jgi:signal transduction histidine kinase
MSIILRDTDRPTVGRSGEGPVVLVVDDDRHGRFALAAALASEEYRAVEAASGEEAVELAGHYADALAVVLLDIRMPGLDGYQTAPLLRERAPGAPIIFLTAHGADDAANVAEGYATGAVDFLAKPPNIAMLRAKIGVFVELHRRAETIRRQAEAQAAGDRARREIEERLHQIQHLEATAALASGMAHDFNNVLTVVSGHLYLAQSKLGDREPTIGRLLGHAIEGAERGAELTKRLLAFARHQPLEPGPVVLADVVERTLPLLRGSLGERIKITTALAPDGPTALADASQVEHALINLVLNARDAMPDGGQLTVETGRATRASGGLSDPANSTYAMLAVGDTGVGMAPEVAHRVFEPFFTTRRDRGGTGLGLSTVFGFARQSGGHLELETEPGRGTLVRLLLPLAV